MGPGGPRAAMAQGLVFITGASSGIGAACARAFAAAGHPLVLTARRAERLDALHDEIMEKNGVEVTVLPFDVRDSGALRVLERAESDLLARVEVLVNNAGLARGRDPIHEGDPDAWDEMLDTNVKGLLRVTRAIVPHMVKRGSGHVVNLGSTAGRWVYPGGAVYCASKFAVRALTEGMRMDLHGTGVRVTTIDPGLVKTEFSEVRFDGDVARAAKVYEGLEVLTPEDIAETVLWCTSRPKHVNVQELVIYPTDQASVTMVKRQGE